MRLPPCLWYPTLQVPCLEVTASWFYVFPFLWKRKTHALARKQHPDILSVPVKLLSNCSRSAGGADICCSPAACHWLCHSQSQGMPHTFCLFYMSKQIVNWLIIFVLTMSFTAVSPSRLGLFALFKYEGSGPPSELKSHQAHFHSWPYREFIGGNHLVDWLLCCCHGNNKKCLAGGLQAGTTDILEVLKWPCNLFVSVFHWLPWHW